MRPMALSLNLEGDVPSVAQYVATDDFIAKNPETLKRFNAALHMGIAWVNKNLATPTLVAHVLMLDVTGALAVCASGRVRTILGRLPTDFGKVREQLNELARTLR